VKVWTRGKYGGKNLGIDTSTLLRLETGTDTMDNILILDFTKQSKTKQNNAEYKKSRQGGLNTFEAIDWNLD
jgi:hypothetical protein